MLLSVPERSARTGACQAKFVQDDGKYVSKRAAKAIALIVRYCLKFSKRGKIMELKLEGITKSYTKGKKRKNALEDFSLTLTEGVYGLLGPNGAGKSTLINIITGIIGRDSGSISFTDGNDNSFLSHLGFMPQGMDFYRNFTAKDYIKYIMALKKYSPDNADEYALTTLGKVNLRADADKKIGAFSGGMKQRLGIAQAIVGEPKVLIFDELLPDLTQRSVYASEMLLALLPQTK